MPPDARQSKLTNGPLWGVLIGFNAWWIALAIFLLVMDKGSMIPKSVLPLGATSLGLSLLGLLLFHFVIPMRRADPRVFALLLSGFVLESIGILLLLFAATVAPIIEADRDMQKALDRMQTTWQVPEIVPILSMLVGCLLLGMALRGVRSLPR